MESVKQPPPYRTVTRRSDEPKLEIGETIQIEEGIVGVVLAPLYAFRRPAARRALYCRAKARSRGTQIRGGYSPEQALPSGGFRAAGPPLRRNFPVTAATQWPSLSAAPIRSAFGRPIKAPNCGGNAQARSYAAAIVVSGVDPASGRRRSAAPNGRAWPRFPSGAIIASGVDPGGSAASASVPPPAQRAERRAAAAAGTSANTPPWPRLPAAAIPQRSTACQQCCSRLAPPARCTRPSAAANLWATSSALPPSRHGWVCAALENAQKPLFAKSKKPVKSGKSVCPPGRRARFPAASATAAGFWARRRPLRLRRSIR